MAIPDEAQALKARSDQLIADTDALAARISDPMFTRLRPLAQLSWVPDADLKAACDLAAGRMISALIPPGPPKALG